MPDLPIPRERTGPSAREVNEAASLLRDVDLSSVDVSRLSAAQVDAIRVLAWAADVDRRPVEPVVLPDGCVDGHSPGLMSCELGADWP